MPSSRVLKLDGKKKTGKADEKRRSKPKPVPVDKQPAMNHRCPFNPTRSLPSKFAAMCLDSWFISPGISAQQHATNTNGCDSPVDLGKSKSHSYETQCSTWGKQSFRSCHPHDG